MAFSVYSITRRFRSPGTVVILTTLISACSFPNDALEEAARQLNSFPPALNALDDFVSTSTGDSSSLADLDVGDQVRITLEVPESVEPGGEATRRNLRIVEPDTITVYQTDQSLGFIDFEPVRIKRESDGRAIITFDNGTPVGPNVIIEATYGGTTLRALATDVDSDIKINPFSDLLIQEILGNYTPGEFDQVMDCVNDVGGTLCINKYVWGTLADQIHDFEIDIPTGLNADQAISFLTGRGDLISYMSAMADYALLDSTAAGVVSASSADYNTVLWAPELAQTFREASISGSGQWGTRSASEKTVTDINGTGYFYPGLTLTNFSLFNINVTQLSSDIPYNRQVLIQTSSNDFFERSNWDINSHSSAPGAATLEEDTRLLAGRSMYQSITGRTSSEIIGWTRNPYYLDAFAGGSPDEPDRLVSSYFTAGKAIELVSEQRKLKRDQLLENYYVSVLELNLLREEGFQEETLNGRDYNVVYLSTQVDDEGAEPFVIESGVGSFSISGQNVTASLTTSSVRRSNTGIVSSSTGLRAPDWLISERPSRVFVAGEGQQQVNLGRLSLDSDTVSNPDDIPQVGIGASTPDGDLLAFNIDTGTIGNGLLIAGEQTSATRPSSGTFKLQGVGLAMADNTNRLAHFNNAVLTIQSTASAELDRRRLEVTHDVSGETVSAPATQAPGPLTLAYAGTGSGNVTFTGGNVTLTGFHTADQNQFYLQVRETAAPDELLGLVLATRIP